MDVMTKEQRRLSMSHNRSKNSSPELLIRKALHRAGFRYRVCDRRYPGSPDIVLPRYYAVIFINGCFWHAHANCRYFRFPSSNQTFWLKKFLRNRERDARNLREYQERSWRVCVVWECAIRGPRRKQKIDELTAKVIHWLEEEGDPFLELRGAWSPEGSGGDLKPS